MCRLIACLTKRIWPSVGSFDPWQGSQKLKCIFFENAITNIFAEVVRAVRSDWSMTRSWHKWAILKGFAWRRASARLHRSAQVRHITCPRTIECRCQSTHTSAICYHNKQLSFGPLSEQTAARWRVRVSCATWRMRFGTYLGVVNFVLSADKFLNESFIRQSVAIIYLGDSRKLYIWGCRVAGSMRRPGIHRPYKKFQRPSRASRYTSTRDVGQWRIPPVSTYRHQSSLSNKEESRSDCRNHRNKLFLKYFAASSWFMTDRERQFELSNKFQLAIIIFMSMSDKNDDNAP